MNCEEFQDILFEYVEGNVPQEQRADADGHLARCAECNAALRREKQVQQRLSSGLQQTVAALYLGSQGRAQLLKVFEANRQSSQRSQAQVFAELWVRVVAALGAAAVIAGLAVWIWRAGVSPQITQETGPTPVQSRFPSRSLRFKSDFLGSPLLTRFNKTVTLWWIRLLSRRIL